MTDLDHITRGCIERDIVPADPDWITTADAAKLLCVSRSSFLSFRLSGTLRTKSRSPHGRGAQGNGRLWHRADVELAAAIRRECTIGATAAARVARALRERGIAID